MLQPYKGHKSIHLYLQPNNMQHTEDISSVMNENGITDLCFILVYHEGCDAMRGKCFLESVGPTFSLWRFFANEYNWILLVLNYYVPDV
jgi:hypothetical protein